MTDNIYEVVISFHPGDLSFVRKLANDLKEGGLMVWFADPDNNQDQLALVQEKGKAVTACKVFVLILSEKSCHDAHINDEVALAYISNSSIFPIGMMGFNALSENMDSGMRLMLAKINWVFFVKEQDYETSFPSLLQRITNDLAKKKEPSPITESASPFEFLNSYTHVGGVNVDEGSDSDPPEEFWARNFKSDSEVTWTDFKNSFLQEYGNTISEMYGQQKERFFVNLMYKDIFNLSKIVKKSIYSQFCSISKSSDPDIFFKLLQEYGRGMHAMREVFDMDSSLRLSAVQNLGKFSTPAVVNELMRMMDDDDANIRAVSAIALARSGKYTKKAIDKLVTKLTADDDRLVRESICYSLAYLQAKDTVQVILDTWRNDPIASVREAAQAALKMFDCEEAKESIYMTEVLNSEISALQKLPS